MKDSPHADIARPRTGPPAKASSQLNRYVPDGPRIPSRDRASPSLYDAAAHA